MAKVLISPGKTVEDPKYPTPEIQQMINDVAKLDDYVTIDELERYLELKKRQYSGIGDLTT